MKIASKSSFTLFELLIVILIISIIYGIFIERLNSKEEEIKRLGLEDIHEFLSSYDFNESVKLRCVDQGRSCYLFLDGQKREKIPFSFRSEPKVYDFDIHGMLSQVRFVPLFEGNMPKDVCFEYDLYPNGSGSSYIVEYEKRYYVFYSYLHPVRIVKSIAKAQDLFDPTPWIPTDSSDYNF
ncbi:hypothetical protein NitYY0826_P11 (plasmid) [Nitratiruptor sp. YY08-26]|uniref:hypothetical protein n=1 Tax=unclassified Nitratiruptor TaxID=2624044 RepID=UPI0018EBF381|nr:MULTISPECIES: hypothetical protein [unclassified Nitratiruptor]BCD63170.1 hypothetical protein NitYY0813_P11 [Nitratiruptor sp. YY08-13]BCD67106.1 hypothetical protein NitYY0826_P11 [Nitratiruptor sp. YY08-26]